MSDQKRIEDYGIKIGKLPKGKLNKITDVKGIKVGHYTIDNDENKTGVTVILPHEKNIFKNKVTAASYILNGFGKTAGLMQIDELGTIETPIALTNTMNVGLVYDAIVEYMIEECKKDKIQIASVNPVVCECNDGYLNNMYNRAVKKEHLFHAIENAGIDFAEGDIGGGKGMSCHHLKGGIGSASRIVELDGEHYTVGVLVQSNHGKLEDLTINGKNTGKEISEKIKAKAEEERRVEGSGDDGRIADRNEDEDKSDKGSIIMIIATDIPCENRQLRRICKRAGVGLARLGSYTGHGSGEVMIAFSTSNIIYHEEKKEIVPIRIINENKIDKIFRAVAEATEEAVLNSMITANTVKGYSGKIREGLKEYF